MSGQVEYFIQLEKQKEGGSWWWEVGQMGSGGGAVLPRSEDCGGCPCVRLWRSEFQNLQCEVPSTLHHESLCLGPVDSLQLIVPLLPHTVCG